MKITKAIFLLLVTAALQFAQAAPAKDCFVYFATFTKGSSKGIYVSRLDVGTGKLSAPELAAAAPNPNYLAISPNGLFLYAATFITFTDGMVDAFTIDPDSGKLKEFDQKFSGSAEPCHVSLDAAGQCLFVANYTGGSVKSFHVNPDGSLTDGTSVMHHGSSINPKRQTSAHAHCMMPAPGGKFVLACDLGMDKVMIYKVDPANAALTANKPAYAKMAPGSGPRHVAFSPDGKTAYVDGEMACTVTVFAWDGLHGKLHARQTISLLPPGVALTNTFTAAEIEVSPDGRFVYATVRGHDSVTVLAVDPKNGRLSFVENVPCDGNVPRGMGIDPTGRWMIVANQKSDTVTVFSINPDTGRLTPTGQVLSVGSPIDVKFAPAL